MAETLTRNSDDGVSLGRAGALIGILAGGGLGSLRMLLDGSPEAFGLGNVAFLLTFVLPFVLALSALRLDRSTMRAAIWLGSGALGIAGSVIAFSGVSLVLLIPGGLLIAAAIASLRVTDTSPEWPVVLIPIWLFVIGVSAFLVLFMNDDPHSWSTPNSSHSSSDYITVAEGATSLAIWAAGLIVLGTAIWLWSLAAQRRDATR
ncbi:MAG: hypothetical protein M9890_03430 [Thermomicrobiales bacterium]|nr:hypothetical protein [Thermomicrobiales bacterium]